VEVEDDYMNIICIGAQLVAFPFAMELVHIFLSFQFSGEARHVRRLAKITQIEKTEMQNGKSFINSL
jgi:ribose 5-phosphate isomerase RpiB